MGLVGMCQICSVSVAGCRKLALALAVVVAAPAINGCGEDQSVAGTGSPPSTMDLAVGNSWHYQSRINEPGAPVIDVSRAIVEHMEIRYMERDILVAHERVVTKSDKVRLPGVSRLLRNEADGLFCYGYVDSEGVSQISEPYLVAPANANKGDLFEVSAGEFLACVATDSVVETGFGEFAVDVFEYRLFEGTIVVPEVFLVPDVGLTRYYNIQISEYMVGYDFE